MKIYILGTLFTIISLPSFSQSMLSGELGVGNTTFKGIPSNTFPIVSTSSHITGRFDFSYLKRDPIHKHLYLGVRIFDEQYSFQYDQVSGGHGGFGGYSQIIDHNSTFAFIAPVVEFGMGRLQIWHVGLFAAGGLRIYARQSTEEATYPSGYITYSSAGDVHQFIFRPGITFSQHFPIHKQWDITIAEGDSIMIGDLTRYSGEGVHPGSIYLTAGISRVFKRLPVPAKRVRKPFKSNIQ
jgi:hypothetical protein